MGNHHATEQKDHAARNPATFGLAALAAVFQTIPAQKLCGPADLASGFFVHQDGGRARWQPPPLPSLWTASHKEAQKAFPPMDEEDVFEIKKGINLEFWSQGLSQFARNEISTAVQPWGSWTTQDEARMYNSDVVTIGIAPTSTDPRLKHFIVALVHHTHIGGEPYRKGAVTTILPGETFHDLNQLITLDQRYRIKALSLSQKQVNAMPPGFYTVKTRMKDATKVAKEVALSHRPTDLEEELPITDKRYAKIAPSAIQRTWHLLEDPEHFMHQAQEAGKERRKQARDKKNQLFLDIGNASNETGHQWTHRGRGLQCQRCNKGIDKHFKYQDLLAVQQEECQATQGLTFKGGGEEPAETKAGFVKKLIEGQIPGIEDHQLELQTNYSIIWLANGAIYAPCETLRGISF